MGGLVFAVVKSSLRRFGILWDSCSLVVCPMELELGNVLLLHFWLIGTTTSNGNLAPVTGVVCNVSSPRRQQVGLLLFYWKHNQMSAPMQHFCDQLAPQFPVFMDACICMYVLLTYFRPYIIALLLICWGA